MSQNQTPNGASAEAAAGWPGYTAEDLAWFAETYADTEWAVHVIGPDDVHVNEPDAQGEHNPDGKPLTERSAWALADSVNRFNAWYRAKFGEKPAYTQDLIPNVFHRGVLVAGAPPTPASTGGSASGLVVSAFCAAGDCEPCQGTGLNIGQPGDCPTCGGTGSAPVFRVGDLVEITGRDGGEVTNSSGANLNGKTGFVAEIDDNPEYPVGLAVEGYLGLVWCGSGEIRHAAAQGDPFALRAAGGAR